MNLKNKMISICQSPICSNRIKPGEEVFCSDNCRKDYYDTIEEKVGYYGIPRETKCKCPECGVIFVLLIHWTGNGMPRIFCKDCSIFIERKKLTDITPLKTGMRVKEYIIPL